MTLHTDLLTSADTGAFTVIFVLLLLDLRSEYYWLRVVIRLFLYKNTNLLLLSHLVFHRVQCWVHSFLLASSCNMASAFKVLLTILKSISRYLSIFYLSFCFCVSNVFFLIYCKHYPLKCFEKGTI